jgi:hypothetical protein
MTPASTNWTHYRAWGFALLALPPALLGLAGEPVLFFLWSAAVLIAGASFWNRGAASTDLFSPMNVVLAAVFGYALAGTTIYMRRLYPYDAVLSASWYLFLFVLMYAVGVSAELGDVLARLIPRPPEKISVPKLVLASVVSLPAGLALFYVLIRSSGLESPMKLLADLAFFRSSSGAEGKLYVFLASLFLVQAPFWAWLIRGRVPILFYPVMVAYALLILTLTLVTGSRGSVLRFLLGLVFVYHCCVRRITFARGLLYGLIAVVPAVGFMAVLAIVRLHPGATVSTIIDTARHLDWSKAFSAVILRMGSGFEGFTKIMTYIKRLPLLMGESFYDMWLLPVPRSILPNKPYGFDSQILWAISPRYSVLKNYGEDFSMPGEFYMNFYVGGLLAGAWCFGVLIRAVQRYYCENINSRSFIFLYEPVVVLPLSYMQSGIINSLHHGVLGMNLALGLMFLVLIKGRLRPQSF